MTLPIPIRVRNDASRAKRFGFCTCTPAFLREDPTPLLSADTKLPRICTFHSYLKSRSFNRCAPLEPISFSFYRCKIRGRAIPRFKSSGVEFSLPFRSSLATRHQPLATAFVTPLDCILANPDSITPLDCILAHSGGGCPLPNTSVSKSAAPIILRPGCAPLASRAKPDGLRGPNSVEGPAEACPSGRRASAQAGESRRAGPPKRVLCGPTSVSELPRRRATPQSTLSAMRYRPNLRILVWLK